MSEEVPLWLELARGQVGVKEIPGNKHNPTVVQYFAEASHAEIRDDETPWCAAFVGAMLHRAGIKPSGSLMARSYLRYGDELKKPIVGAIAIFPRAGSPGSGHVTFVDDVSEDGKTFSGLGGNQRNSVCRVTYRTSEALGFRYPSNVLKFPSPVESDDEEVEAEVETATEAPATSFSYVPVPVPVASPPELKAQVDRLREVGSSTIKSQDHIEKVTAGLGVTTAFMTAFNDLREAAGPLFIAAIIGGCAYVFYLTNQTKISRARRALLGKPTDQ